MQPCPECNTQLEAWEVKCHKCGKVISSDPVPVVKEINSTSPELAEAFQSWFVRGKAHLSLGCNEEAVVCFHEALRRLKGLDNADQNELEIREKLANALEGANKLAEAAEQFLAMVNRVDSLELKERYKERASKLESHALELLAVSNGKDEFVEVEAAEARIVPLYCLSCKRLLAEAEVYGFRKDSVSIVRCLCGAEGRPLSKLDAKHKRAVKEAQAIQSRKAKLIDAASTEFPGGKNKVTAALLAIVFGDFGIHKYYLGERAACFWSVLFCWTLIPWIFALFEAVHYLSMSRVSWNLSYNIERVLASIPAEGVAGEPHDELFSMEVTEDPEDFVDEFTSGSGPVEANFDVPSR